MMSPDRDEREALRLDDIASALNAGLPLTAILKDADVAGGLALALKRQRDVTFAPGDEAMLEAAEVAGTMPACLRLMAELRRRRASFTRHLIARLRYPVFVLLAAVCAAIASAPIRGQSYSSLGLTMGGILVGLLLIFWWVRSRVRDPNFDGGPAPLQELLQELGEVPYLQSLLGLYGAGVKVQQAHELAANSVGVPYVRYRLRAANAGLAQNQPLTDSLAAAQALCPETQQLLATGEAAGELEDALRRSLGRRMDCLERRLGRWALAIGSTVYVLAAAYAIYLVLTFYAGLYGAVLGR